MVRASALMIITCLLLISAGGCTSYYRVTDPTTGRVYYATRVEKGRAGDVTLTDSKTGNEVTIQNSEVAKISKDQYEAGQAATGATTRPY